MDWDYFIEMTDLNGKAVLPNGARDQYTTIIKDNFFPFAVEHLASRTYTIESTPYKIKPIGEVEGKVVLFQSDKIIALTYDGIYRVYSYTDHDITELMSAQMPVCIHYYKVFGDTLLWLSTHADGFFAYSIKNPEQPLQLCHLSIPGYTIRPFAIADTIIAVTGYCGDSLRIFSFSYNSQYQLLAYIGDYWVTDMAIISHYLIVIGDTINNGNIPVIFDIQNPADPIRIYTGSSPLYPLGFLYKNNLVIEDDYWGSSDTTYTFLNLSNPAHPQKFGPFLTGAHLIGIINDSMALGTYLGTTAILKGRLNSGFTVVGVIWGSTAYSDFNRSIPPYFIIGGRLWLMHN
jgi:hypothetical protein